MSYIWLAPLSSLPLIICIHASFLWDQFCPQQQHAPTYHHLPILPSCTPPRTPSTVFCLRGVSHLAQHLLLHSCYDYTS